MTTLQVKILDGDLAGQTITVRVLEPNEISRNKGHESDTVSIPTSYVIDQDADGNWVGRGHEHD